MCPDYLIACQVLGGHVAAKEPVPAACVTHAVQKEPGQ